MSNTKNQEILLKGIGASPGICTGRAYLVDKEGVNLVKKYPIGDDQVEDEKNRFKSAVKKAADELRAIMEEVSEDFQEHANIFEMHIVLLKDKMLYDKTIEIIEEKKVNAEWALKLVASDIKLKFRNMSDPYFRDRAEDIVHVSERIIRNLVGAEHVNIGNIDKRVILVAKDLSPAETSQIQVARIQGFVTDRGAITSHTGIIARTLEIPAVLGVGDATGLIRNDDIIIADGATGEIVVHPGEHTLAKYVRRKTDYEHYRAASMRGSHSPANTADGVSIQVMGNIELPEEVVSVRDYGGDGIGLYRTEFQYLSRSDFPTEYELFDKYRDVAEVMNPKPVTIRTLDINGDKILQNSSLTDEANPAMGLRGIRYCLKKPDIFKTQIRAILRAAAFGNVRIMFPMISGCNEIREIRKLMEQAAHSLDKDGVEFNKHIDIGVMVEVPSLAIMADVIAREVDFFSIGTNDLIQYTLAIDRGNRHVAHYYQPLHPAIIRILKYVSSVAEDNGKKISMCGEMAGDPVHIPILLGLGMDELSVNPPSIPLVKRMIRSLRIEDAKLFLKDVIRETTTDGVLNQLQNAYGKILSDEMFV